MTNFTPLPFILHKVSLNTRIGNNRRHLKKEGYVYVVHCAGAYKIGVSVDPDSRVKNLCAPYPITYVFKIYTEDMYGLEKELHERYAHLHTNGEWFLLSEEDIKDLRNYIYSAARRVTQETEE